MCLCFYSTAMLTRLFLQRKSRNTSTLAKERGKLSRFLINTKMIEARVCSEVALSGLKNQSKRSKARLSFRIGTKMCKFRGILVIAIIARVDFNFYRF